MNKIHPTVLIILDGYGYSKETEYNAIFHADKPNIDGFYKHYPHTILNASGKYVGLPENHIGNSEVGHEAIGAGRRIVQSLTVINEEIQNKIFFNNKVLINNLIKLKDVNGNLHLMGLLSDSGHSHIKHLFAFIEAAEKQNIKKIYIHAFLDGRDTPPKSAEKYLNQLQEFINNFNNISIGSIQGRFYGMDRDQNYNRTEKSYKIITEPENIKFQNWHEALSFYYSEGLSDEFIPPTQLNNDAIVKDNDGIIFYNIRADRARQLTATFVDDNFKYFKTKKNHLTFFITPVYYGNNLKTNYLFEQQKNKNTLSDVLAQNNFTVFYIAETEKYAHVTYFFRCGREEPLQNETQVLIPSIHTKNYVAVPCMSAPQITESVLNSLKNSPKDFYIVNYANADMVGHSGNFKATIKAIECIDEQLGKLYKEVVERLNGIMYITADHGNAELKFDKSTGQPNTAHTLNPVPFLMLKKDLKDKDVKLPLHELADIAPFILKNLNLSIPEEMKK